MDVVPTTERISSEVMSLLDSGQQVEPFSTRYPGFDLAAAYDVVARVRDLRKDRGETAIGRKIGFTNRSIWDASGISAPIWNYVFDRTVTDTAGDKLPIELSGMPEPRIEPEVVLHLASQPMPGMAADDLFECLDWAAPGFEVVYSVFPNWDFTAADAAAAFGVHGALIVGDRLDLSGAREDPSLSTFSVELKNTNGISRQGHAENVLGGPLQALQFLLEELERYAVRAPLRQGELVTTGTLTEAMPVRAGETWTARFQGIAFEPLQIRFG